MPSKLISLFDQLEEKLKNIDGIKAVYRQVTGLPKQNTDDNDLPCIVIRYLGDNPNKRIARQLSTTVSIYIELFCKNVEGEKFDAVLASWLYEIRKSLLEKDDAQFGLLLLENNKLVFNEAVCFYPDQAGNVGSVNQTISFNLVESYE